MSDPLRSSPAENTETDPGEQLAPTLARPGDAVVGGALFGPPRHPKEVGTLGRYRVLKKLGQGGMGAVYLGYDGVLGRKVALKVMLPQYAADPESRERFLREARAAAVVRSEHVVTIFDVGEERGVPFIAMEYLLGSPLDQFLRARGELPLAQALRVARETAVGLAAAHALGLVHRDVKPGNIWLEAPKGRVKLLDFGLARAANDDTHLTGTGTVMGTPAYMSPEQGRGRPVDGRSDLFSLGVMLYRLCTGAMPFAGDTTMAVLTSLALDTPAPAREFNSQIPPALDRLLAKLLAKNPVDRFQTAAEVAAALAAVSHPPAGGPLPVVVAVPMTVGAQTQNVWDGIDESASVAVPLASDAGADTAVVSAPTPKPPRKKPERKPSKRPAVLAGVALVVACTVLAAVIVKPWKKEPVAAPAAGESPPPKPAVKPPPAPDPDRKAAEYAISVGGFVSVEAGGLGGEVRAAADLPKGPFRVVVLNLSRGARVTAEGLAAVRGCKHLKSLYLNESPVTDAGMAHFTGCVADLAALTLYSTNVSDAGLAPFKDCKDITLLALDNTKTTDAGLENFKGCRNLTILSVSRTQITNAGLDPFKACTNLTTLSVQGTKVTAEKVAEFAAALPACHVTWDGGTIEPKK